MRFPNSATARALAVISVVVASATGNPLMPAADPHAEVIDGKVWMYPTRTKNGRNFLAYSSADLKTWQEHGPVLDFKDIPWIREDGRKRHGPWAPCIASRDGRFFFYYSVGPQSEEHPSRIGVAAGGSPAGPFVDSGNVLLSGGSGFEAIDPMVFEDPESGIHYFYAGGSAGATLRVFEMNDDMVSFRREIPVQTPRKFTEAPFIHHHAGRYHFTFSHGSFRDSSYSVHYATAESPAGPWNYRGPLLKSDGNHKGPGHHSIVRYPADGDWFIIYHRWSNQRGEGPYSGSRDIAIDRIGYDENGFLLPVKMTDERPEIRNFHGKG